jgi:hypothetical protein
MELKFGLLVMHQIRRSLLFITEDTYLVYACLSCHELTAHISPLTACLVAIGSQAWEPFTPHSYAHGCTADIEPQSTHFKRESSYEYPVVLVLCINLTNLVGQ